MESPADNISPFPRDSFRFFRSYYDAIKCLPIEQQAEVYNALASYSIYGTTPELSGVAQAIFALIKPVADKTSARADGGSRGGRPKKSKSPAAPYSATFEEEAASMESDAEWCAAVCAEYGISQSVLSGRLKSFTRTCNESRVDRPHTSLGDAKSHFRNWLDQKNPHSTPTPKETTPPPPIDYTFDGGFGGMDT